ncbi:hypothetical protein Y032_0037g3495 [Ancylostoma ceylanicum]|uniref:Transformation/transcription domain-associated protein n=1 Tax=Ancylostoma ceylanicum TaxID=53326 RepID=A0A016UKL0_9BILA|nr:hypothetical protein Y032_0037g3495 [Ancylostoma ceylanicum]
MAPQPILPGDQDAIIRTLNDVNQGDESKLKAVQDAWNMFDMFNVTPTFDQFLESLMRAFMKLFSETVPQFIQENNTQTLRKAMLEMILRTSAYEPVKQMSKEIQKQMMRIIVLENEENAILAIKILVDHSKITRTHLIPEVSVMLQHFKQWIKCMCSCLVRPHTFDTIDLTHPAVQLPEETVIETYLQQCYYVQSVMLYPPSGAMDAPKYTLIPRASQSLKTFQEIPMLVIFLYQHHKAGVQAEAMEFLLCCLDFLSIQISSEQKSDEKYNKTLADEFYTAQSKMLAYLSIMGKIREFMEQILANGDRFINGVLSLLEQCPAELIVVRKDVLITLKFFFISDLRPKFIQLLPRLLSEVALIGSGYTAVDHLRGYFYQTMADFLHHVRASLSFDMLAHVAFVFCREMHDNLLPYQIQVICARMLSSVLEGLTKHAKEGEATRDLILMILESLVVKLKMIAVYHLPLLFKQHGAEINYDYKSCDRDGSDNTEDEKASDDVIREEVRRCSIDTAPEMEIGPADPPQPPAPAIPVPKESGHRQSSPSTILTQMYTMNAPPIPLTEARTIVKFILLACKMGTTALAGANRSSQSPPLVRERDIFERMFKYCVQCLDVYMIPYPQPPSRVQVPNSVPGGTRSKEEKDALDALASLFTMLNLDVFGEIFTKYMDFFVVRMAKNLPLQLACNAFLVRADVSFRFGCIIVKYLMDRLPSLAVMNDVSQLYVKLFKIIFSAIGCQNSASPDGEIMLKPYLPELIRKSMEYALCARDPINYFMLLRALFRSIGGGLHDILYSQFLPLLPDLMLFFNKLQWCDHRQMMRELFVELCLTVPVRLSTLLPHLPLLMEPLVCALNGGPNLVQQGLRTLELCVDNLQPDFLFDNFSPVRGGMMQGLYKVVGKSGDPLSVATAVRVLGKFGGANRNMFTEPPNLKSRPKGDHPPYTIRVAFDRPNTSQTFFSTIYGDIALTEIVRTALKQMRLDPTHAHYSPQVRQYAMELARSILLCSISPIDLTEEWKAGLKDLFKDQFKRLNNSPNGCTAYRCAREGDRAIHSDALMILFCGIVGKDLRSKYIKFFNTTIRYLTLQALLEFTGRAALMSLDHPAQCMDGGILVDTIVTALSDSTKDFCQSAIVGLRHINDVCRVVIPDLEMMPLIPFVRYLVESVSALCYASSWFVRLGGASGLMYFIENYPDSVVFANLSEFIESLIEVLIGMTDQVSCGAVDMAVGAIEKLQRRCLTGCKLNDPKVSVFMNCVASHLFSGSQNIRNKTLSMLNLCAEVLGESFSALMYAYRHLFEAHIERAIEEFSVLALLDRCGSLEALCTVFVCQPPLVDVSIGLDRTQKFLRELISVCQMPISEMLELDLFKSMEGCPAHFLPPYTVSEKAEHYKIMATRALVALYKSLLRDASEGRSMDAMPFAGDSGSEKVTLDKIACVAVETILCPLPAVVQAAEEALMQIVPVEANCVRAVGEQVFAQFREQHCERRNAESVAQLYRLVRLNTSLFDNTLASNLVAYICGHASRFPLETSPSSIPQLDGQDVEAITQAVRLLLLVDTTSGSHLATDLAAFIAHFDHHYCTSAYDAWIPPLATLLSRYSRQSMAFFLTEESLSMPCRRALLRKLIKDEECGPIRSLLMEDSSYFANMLQNKVMDPSGEWKEASDAHQTENDIMEREMLCLHIIDAVSRRNVQWFSGAKELILKLRQLWNNGDFKARYVVHAPCDKDLLELTIKMMTEHKYKVPRLIVNCFIRYYRHNNNDLDLLCDILFVFIGRYVTDFCFVREFLEREVIPAYSMEWRRKLFSFVLEKFEAGGSTVIKDLLYVKILQYVLIPSLQWAFERYNVDEILGVLQNPQDQPEMDPDDLVYRLAHIIDQSRQVMSDGIVIALYQLSTLLVKYAPRHVHNNDSKKHGWRLRVFMLFAWSCLTASNRQDATLRYTGFLFISHICQKFLINRKIVLQVFQSLCGSYQYDSRELVRRAADVVTAAMPIRMEDGHQQMFINVKRVLCEEAHSLAHIQHIVSMIVRNYRAYFNCRHALFKPLMGAVRRVISTPNSAMDGVMTRKLALDVCEMVIKWELLRLQKVEQLTQGLTSHDDEFDTLLNDSDGSRATAQSSNEQSSASVSAEFEDQLYKQMSKECVDEVVAMLLKFAIQPTSAVQPHQLHQATIENGKRSIGLMKQCLKSAVWGDVVTIKVGWLEKELSVPPESLVRQENQSQLAQSIAQAQQALEVVINLVAIMPKPLLLQTIRPIQRAIISCLNSGHGALIRLVNVLVAKLFEKSNCSMTGMYEFEILNQFISKYLNDHFNSYVKSSTCLVMNAFTAFSLLRVICSQQPGYLDAMCLQAYIKVLEKAVREHIMHVTEQGETTREKMATAEMIAMALELLRPRIEAISAEAKRTICQNVLLPLIERSSFEKIIDVVLRVVSELVVTHRDEHSANPGLPLLVRLQSVVEKRYRLNGELMKMFLKVVLFVFEHPLLLTSDYADKLEDAFHWGLTTQDRDLREKFLVVFERNLAANPLARLSYILREKDWEPFRDYFWLRHALWLMLRCIPVSGTAGSGHRRVFVDSSATLWRTMLAVAGFRSSSLASDLESDMDRSLPPSETGKPDEPMDTDQEGGVGDEANMSTRLDVLLEDQKSLMIEASSFDFSSAVDSIIGLVFSVQDDVSFVGDMFSQLFNSLWVSMSDEERNFIGGLAVPFMTSGVHVQQAHAVHPVISIFLETFARCNPPIHIGPRAVEFISRHYHAWHRGILLLENQALRIPRMLENPAYMQQMIDPVLQEHLDVLDYLRSLYSELAELDQYAAVWSRRALTADTVKMLAMQQLGDVEEALEHGQATASAMLHRMENQFGKNPIGEAMIKEYEFLDNAYIQCTRELCRWRVLCEIAKNPHVENPELLLEAAVHLPDWYLARQCRDQILACTRPDFVIQSITFGAMLGVLGDPEDGPLVPAKKLVDDVTQALVVGWRVLPPILTHAHIKLLQSMTMIREVGDVLDLKRALDVGNQNCGAVMQEMKTVIKIWRSRTYSLSDEMSFISLMYDWRSQIHTMMVQRFHDWERSGIVMPPGMNPQAILPIHSAATGQLLLARAARERGMDHIAIRTLNKLHTLITLPMMDCHQKVIDHLKTLRRLAKKHSTTAQQKMDLLQEALLITEAVRIEDFSRDQCCRLFYQKGAILSQLERNDDAMHAFSAAAAMIDPTNAPPMNTACNMFKTWAHHLDNLFHNEVHEASAMSRGSPAINCYFEAARIENETRARKYIARILWTAKHVIACGIFSAVGLDQVLKDRARSIVPFNWLPWLPQLMTELQERPSSGFIHVVERIASVYPLLVVSALRPILDAATIEEVIEDVSKGRYKPTLPDDHRNAALCKVLEKACNARLTDVRMWNRLLCGFSTMREFWVERHLRFASQLKDEILRCLYQARDTRLETAKLDDKTLAALSLWCAELKTSTPGEILREDEVPSSSRHALPLQTEDQFVDEFRTEVLEVLDAPPPFGPGLLKLAESVIKWQTKLHNRLYSLPRRYPIRLSSKFLADYNNAMACIEIPSSFNANVTKQYQYVTLIARFNPHVEVVVKGGRVMKKLQIMAVNGKTSVYYLQRYVFEERTNRSLQYLQIVKTLLVKERETARRHLFVFTPTQLVVSSHALLTDCGGAYSMSFVAKKPHVFDMIRPLDVFARYGMTFGMRPDDAITMFYDRIAASEGPLNTVMLETYRGFVVENFIGPSILQNYVLERFTDPTYYYLFRKRIAQQLAVLSVLEMLVRLSPLFLDDVYIRTSTAQLAALRYTFAFDMEVERKVPFRLTPNLQWFLGMTLEGDFLWAAAAVIRCLLRRDQHLLLRPLILDEVIINGNHDQVSACAEANEFIKKLVAETTRMATQEAGALQDELCSAIERARNPENLSQMDPRWHPWF